jgi:hypothetical protein
MLKDPHHRNLVSNPKPQNSTCLLPHKAPHIPSRSYPILKPWSINRTCCSHFLLSPSSASHTIISLVFEKQNRWGNLEKHLLLFFIRFFSPTWFSPSPTLYFDTWGHFSLPHHATPFLSRGDGGYGSELNSLPTELDSTHSPTGLPKQCKPSGNGLENGNSRCDFTLLGLLSSNSGAAVTKAFGDVMKSKGLWYGLVFLWSWLHPTMVLLLPHPCPGEYSINPG